MKIVAHPRNVIQVNKHTSATFSVSSIKEVQALKSKELALTIFHSRSSSADKAAANGKKKLNK